MTAPFPLRPLSAAVLLAISSWACAADAPAEDRKTKLDPVVVSASRYLPAYTATHTRTATKTDTPLVNVPQAITVVTEELIKDQAMTSLPETLRYVPGAGVAQGEGNRDTSVLRGSSSTADFYLDGVRDDVQYLRDLYNVERVEVLKGANAMIFGRGGSGGVVNRVSKRAEGISEGEFTLQYGRWNRRRATADWQAPVNDTASFRINAMVEDSRSFREGFYLRRHGVSPSVHFDLGDRDTLDLTLEHFRDARVADRGVPSLNGEPLALAPETFIGNPEQSPVRARANTFDVDYTHRFEAGHELRNHFRAGDYDKFYQNVFGNGTVKLSDGSVGVVLNAYNNASTRNSWFNQTDFVARFGRGRVLHTVLAGVELGRQDSRGETRRAGFPLGGTVRLDNPRYPGTVVFTRGPGDAFYDSTAKTAAFYLQDQIEFGPHFQAVLGARFDHFDMDLTDLRNGSRIRRTDRQWSPRAGLIWKPVAQVSIYGSYSVAFQPRGGEQLSSLTLANSSLAPEKFVNREVGLKWDIRPNLAFTAAVFQLDRTNVAVADPTDPTRMLLVGGQTAKGLELGLAGRITPHWQIMGGYAWQTGEITTTQSASAPRGNRLAQLPMHSASLWNRFELNEQWGLGVGTVYRAAFYPSTDNAVRVPGFVRTDAAVYYDVNRNLGFQLNVENLFDRAYYATAHNNNNISPGAPRGFMLTMRYGF